VGDVYLGGPIKLLNRIQHTTFSKYRLDPKETRVLFKARKWQTIAAFQTRNPIHRATSTSRSARSRSPTA
jgi:sulfate adenylyltransferase